MVLQCMNGVSGSTYSRHLRAEYSPCHSFSCGTNPAQWSPSHLEQLPRLFSVLRVLGRKCCSSHCKSAAWGLQWNLESSIAFGQAPCVACVTAYAYLEAYYYTTDLIHRFCRALLVVGFAAFAYPRIFSRNSAIPPAVVSCVQHSLQFCLQRLWSLFHPLFASGP